MLPLPPELRAAGANHVWNEFRRQWRLPFAILTTNDSFSLRRSYSTSPRLLEHQPVRSSGHSKSIQIINHGTPSSLIHPESLDDTLEAHRSTNRASLVSETLPDVDDRKFGVFRPRIEPVVWDTSKFEERDAEQKRLEPVDGAGSKRRRRPYPWMQMSGKDYTGMSQQPRKEWAIPRWQATQSMHKPWLSHLEHVSLRDSHYVDDFLTQEILAFEKYMESTAAEKAAVEKAHSDVRQIIESIDPAIKVSVIGSRATGLAMPLSDIDISIQDTNPAPLKPAPPDPAGPTKDEKASRWSALKAAKREQTLDLLRSVKRKLNKKGGPKAAYRELCLIEARVPIVQARHNDTNLEIQIQSMMDNYYMTDSSSSTEFVKAYIAEFPTLRPLFFVLRQVLKMRGLGDPRNYGIGSYPLIMMIVAALKFSSSRFDLYDAGKQLLYFFDFYTKMNFQSTGIAVDPPELFRKQVPKSKRVDPQAALTGDEIANPLITESFLTIAGGRKYILSQNGRPYIMCLQDPANPFNNLGVQAVGIKHIQATFRTLGDMMKTNMGMFDKRNPYAPYSILEPCLAGNYENFMKRRTELQRTVKRPAKEPVVAQYL